MSYRVFIGGDIRLVCPWWDEPNALWRACKGEFNGTWSPTKRATSVPLSLPVEPIDLRREVELLLNMAKGCDARGEAQSPQKEWTFYQGKIAAYQHILDVLAGACAKEPG